MYFPTEHFDSACQKRQLLDQGAQKNSASTAAMRKTMDAFLRKANKKESQSEETNETNVAEEMTKKTEDQDDSDRDLDLDSTL